MSQFPQTWKSTVSHWQATNRGPDTLYTHNDHAALPTEEVDYVIIGAGMTGSTLAYHLTRPEAGGKKVVLLEAKDVASGASGRNGGHIAPFSYVDFAHLLVPLSAGGAGLDEEQALEVMQQERENLKFVTDTVSSKGWEVDLWRGQKIEVAVTKVKALQVKKAYDRWAKAHKQSRFRDVPLDWEFIGDQTEAKKISRCYNARITTRGPAGSIHPHKLATHFLQAAIADGCRFYSWCPVSNFSEHKSGGYIVDCGKRGKVRAKQVICATNAHTRWFFKGQAIDKHLTPYKAHAANITPPPSFSGPNALDHTYVVEEGPYLIQTPHSGIVLGIDGDMLVRRGAAASKDVWENVDDSFVVPGIQKALVEWCKKNFTHWGEEAPGEGGLRTWSGIICHSADMLPLVGAVPGREGLWIAAGFHGHGMGRIPHVTKCLAHTILTGQWHAELPTTYKITNERMKRAEASPPPWTLPGEGNVTQSWGGWFGLLFGGGGKSMSLGTVPAKNAAAVGRSGECGMPVRLDVPADFDEKAEYIPLLSDKEKKKPSPGFWNWLWRK